VDIFIAHRSATWLPQDADEFNKYGMPERFRPNSSGCRTKCLMSYIRVVDALQHLGYRSVYVSTAFDL